MAVRRTFRDEGLHSKIMSDGFVKVDLLEEDEVAELRQRFELLNPADDFVPGGVMSPNVRDYHCTFLDPDLAYRADFDRLVHDLFDHHVKDLFEDYTLLIANAYVKQPDYGDFEVHQNWNITYDPTDITLTIWVPLFDTNSQNGTLEVIPGSHKLTDTIAAVHDPHYFVDYEDRLESNHLEQVEVAAGQAVIFDDSLIHGSQRNRGTSQRIALQIEAIPKEAIPAVFLPDGGRLLAVSSPARFWLNASVFEMASWAEEFGIVGTIDSPNRKIPYEEFVRLLANGNDARNRLLRGRVGLVTAIAVVGRLAPSWLDAELLSHLLRSNRRRNARRSRVEDVPFVRDSPDLLLQEELIQHPVRLSLAVRIDRAVKEFSIVGNEAQHDDGPRLMRVVRGRTVNQPVVIAQRAAGWHIDRDRTFSQKIAERR